MSSQSLQLRLSCIHHIIFLCWFSTPLFCHSFISGSKHICSIHRLFSCQQWLHGLSTITIFSQLYHFFVVFKIILFLCQCARLPQITFLSAFECTINNFCHIILWNSGFGLMANVFAITDKWIICDLTTQSSAAAEKPFLLQWRSHNGVFPCRLCITRAHNCAPSFTLSAYWCY